MVRKSAGFVSKKPHKKSRGGCLTCKRKKVKVRLIQDAYIGHELTSNSVMKAKLRAAIVPCDD
jgi:hypothetical protein